MHQSTTASVLLPPPASLPPPPWAGGSTGESTRWRSGRAPSLRTPLALYASRQGLPEVLAFFWHPHHIAHHPRECTGSLHCLLCAAAFWCSKTSLHAAQANALPFIALRPVSAHRPASAWACGRRRDNSGLWWRSFKEFAPDSPASNGACQHLPRGGVETLCFNSVFCENTNFAEFVFSSLDNSRELFTASLQLFCGIKRCPTYL